MYILIDSTHKNPPNFIENIDITQLYDVSSENIINSMHPLLSPIWIIWTGQTIYME